MTSKQPQQIDAYVLMRRVRDRLRHEVCELQGLTQWLEQIVNSLSNTSSMAESIETFVREDISSRSEGEEPDGEGPKRSVSE